METFLLIDEPAVVQRFTLRRTWGQPAHRLQIKLNQPKVGFSVSSPNFGGGGQPPWVRLRSMAELQSFGGSVFCDDGNPGPNNLVVSVANMPSIFDQAFIALGGAQRSASVNLNPVTLTGVSAGTHDLVAHSQNQSGGPPTGVHRIIVRRNQNTSVSPITPALDFGPAGDGSAPIGTTIGTRSIPRVPGGTPGRSGKSPNMSTP